MDRTFAALADPTRRAILERLAADARSGQTSGGSKPGETSGSGGKNSGGEGVRVTELAAPFVGDIPGAAGAMSLPAVSKHLRVLERAGLLKQEKDGRVRRCHLRAEPLQQAHEWVAFYRQFWTQRLDALADYLEKESATPPAKRKPKRGQ